MKYFDLHCDTAYECDLQNLPFEDSALAVSAKKGRCFEKWKQVFAIWIRDDAEDPYRLYRQILSGFRKKLADAPDNLTPYFSVEGGAVIEDRIDRIDELKKDGVRFFGLTWNGENRIAGGSLTDKGLTEFGEQVIDTLNRAGLSTDLSHVNDRSFATAVERAEYPMATHSNCRSICNVPRNLEDAQIKQIARKGGVIGLCFYPPFLCGEVTDALYCNIRHLCGLGLEDFIAIGSDFDGAKMSPELENLSQVPALYQKLREMGLKSVLLDKVFYENAERYMKTFDKRPGFV